MKRNFFSRLTAVGLALLLLVSSPALALTAEECAELLQLIYIDDVPQSVLEQPTIEAMLEALGDPYTQYFTAEEYSSFSASMSDTVVVGVGISITNTDDGLYVERVLDYSPALAGGMAAGDLIIAVDGESILGLDTDAVTERIRGKEGTTVQITYLRDGVQTTVTLTRARIVVPATTSQLLDDHIGYIRCTTFGGETVGHFKEGIETYQDKATVWIVDLRSNLGGSTDAATQAAGLFTGAGNMAYLRNGADQYSAYRATDTSLTLRPVIVLVDENSASASELFASAIRDCGSGIIIGTRTYGKGVAQSVLDKSYMPDLFPDGDAIKITAYRFFSPKGNTTDQIGVIPDLLVDPQYTADVAYLLSGPAPAEDTGNSLRVDLDRQWYVDINDIAAYPGAFQALLNAISADRNVWTGVDGSPDWNQTTVAEIAAEYGVDYQTPIFLGQRDSQYDTALSVLKTYDLIHGYPDGAFHPQSTLTRAELCQLLYTALNCTAPEIANPYTDVRDDAWYTPAILAMTNLGLVNGMGHGRFLPEEPIDHQQFITVMGRLAKRLNMNLYDDAAEMPVDALDLEGLKAYDAWAKPSVWLLSYSQKGYFGNSISLLWDAAGDIDPTAATTRDEAAYTFYWLLSFIGILPT